MPTNEEYMNWSYPIIVKESTYTDGSSCYEAEHPDLPGCMGQGDSVNEAIEDLNHARYLYIESLIEDGLPVPPPSDPLPVPFNVTVSTGSASETQTESVIVDSDTQNYRNDLITPPWFIFPKRIRSASL